MRKRGRPPKQVEGLVEALNSGPTEEDLELERRLQAIDAEEIVQAPQVSDRDMTPRASKPVNDISLLNHEKPDVKPAETLSQLRDQVFMAEQYGCNAIEVHQNILKTFLKQDYPTPSGYVWYQNVRLYEAGTFDRYKDYDFRTVDDVLFKRK